MRRLRSWFSSIKAFGQPYPLFILTGGDPAKRSDIFDIIAYARGEGLRVAMTPSATPLMTREAVRRFADAGLVRLAVSLDGKDAPPTTAFAASQDRSSARCRSSTGAATMAWRPRFTPP